MTFVLFLSVGFGITNALAHLRSFEWFRRLLSGVTDEKFRRLSSCNRLTGCRSNFIGGLLRSHASLGVIVGSLMYVFLYLISRDSIMYMRITEYSALDTILFGFLQSSVNFVVWLILRRLGAEELP
jgi:hypothetical protein